MRIIAGTARGRKIDAPEGTDTRPTLDRVKESVFGTIQFHICDTQVLDLFAGSGNLGIEALSRGAKHAVFCDVSKNCTDLISSNLNKLGFSSFSVYNADYDTVLKKMQRDHLVFDLVFLDPPYASMLAQNAIYALCELKLLSNSAIIVAEHSIDQEIQAPPCLLIHSRKTYRETAVTILKREASDL